MNFQRFDGKTDTYLVLLHGHGLNKTFFGKLMPKLAAEGYSHIAIDLPGYGFARDIDCHSYAEIVDYVLGILNAEKINAIIPTGFSFGGFISLALNARIPDRVKALILMSSSYEITFKTLNVAFVLSHFPICTAINELCWLKYREGQKDFDMSELATTASDMMMVRHSSVATNRKNMLKNAGIMRKETRIEDLKKVAAPVLMIQPDKDEFFKPASYDLMAKTFPNVTRHIIKSRHNVAPHWDEISGYMQEFLKSLTL